MPPTTASSPSHPSSSAAWRRRSWLAAGAAFVLGGCAMPPAVAVGQSMVDVEIVDRETGQVLETYRHAGRWYVAGRPGARYAIRITNRTGARILAVTAVDGVNVLNGQTAAWGQSGYVFDPGQRYEVTGWRKSDTQVAAFEFTSLPDSYAARTGRPLDVGVIGVAVFRERAVRPVWRDAAAANGAEASRGAPPSTPAPLSTPLAAEREGKSEQAKSTARADRLGTGHGQREDSWVTTTQFERASPSPDEIVSVQYDRYENLLAAGIIGRAPIARPQPFPGSRDVAGYVPDPPSRY
ncbi:MAG TPA: hypothetical protein VIO33_00375 [Burkholderiaceae bacterium]